MKVKNETSKSTIITVNFCCFKNAVRNQLGKEKADALNIVKEETSHFHIRYCLWKRN